MYVEHKRQSALALTGTKAGVLTIYDDEGRERVMYHPPKSVAFGHQARKRGPRLAWSMTKSFLGGFADYRFGFGDLQVYLPDAWTSETAANASLARARELLGPEDPRYQAKMWRFTDEGQLPSVSELALENDKWPNETRGPVALHFFYTFIWRDLLVLPAGPAHPSDDQTWRANASHLGVSLGGGPLFLQPTFVFPFPWDSPEFAAFLAQIEPATPFRFRDQYFKRLLPSKKGGYLRSVNLKKGWR